MKTTGTRPRQGSEFWSNHIKRWRVSGQSQKAYCADNGLAVSTLARWIGCTRQGKRRPMALVEVSGVNEWLPTASAPSVIELEVGLVRARVREGIGTEELRALLVAMIEAAR